MVCIISGTKQLYLIMYCIGSGVGAISTKHKEHINSPGLQNSIVMKLEMWNAVEDAGK